MLMQNKIFFTVRMEPLYFKRFVKADAGKAHALQTITTDQYALILSFYEDNKFVLRGEDSVNLLRSFIPKIEIIDQDVIQDLYHVRVLEWPYLKVMCLKCAATNPCIWKYYDEEENELFQYRLDTFSIFCPPSMLSSDRLDSTGHGID